MQRSIDLYRSKNYDEEWILKRIKGVQDRKKLTDVWNKGGITTDIQYAILTNEIYKQWSGMIAKEYKTYKGLHKESLRDNMTDLEIVLADLGEIATREIAKSNNPKGLKENIEVAKKGGHAAKVAKEDIERNMTSNVVSKDNKLNYKYKQDNLINNK